MAGLRGRRAGLRLRPYEGLDAGLMALLTWPNRRGGYVGRSYDVGIGVMTTGPGSTNGRVLNWYSYDHSAAEQSSWLVQARIVIVYQVSAASPVSLCCQAFGSVNSSVVVLDGSSCGQYRIWKPVISTPPVGAVAHQVAQLTVVADLEAALT